MEYHFEPDTRIRLLTCLRTHCDDPYYYVPKVELPVAFHRTCRQAYHEARNAFYTTNIFRLHDPRVGRLFLQRISDYSLTLRSVHLNICINTRGDEHQWDHTLHQLAEDFKTVQNLYIDLEEHPRNMRRTFLKGLLELKKLPLKTFEICTNVYNPHDYPPSLLDQERAWARSMESAVLGKE